jgi:hypothetical protein
VGRRQTGFGRRNHRFGDVSDTGAHVCVLLLRENARGTVKWTPGLDSSPFEKTWALHEVKAFGHGQGMHVEKVHA